MSRKGETRPTYPKGVLRFEPDKVIYRQRYTVGGIKRKDGTSCRPTGPYWYAFWVGDGTLQSAYIGKELPEVCKPYVNNVMSTPPQVGTLKPYNDSLSYVSIQAALDKGKQVVIRIPSIAFSCNAQYAEIDSGCYVLYRDPQ